MSTLLRRRLWVALVAVCAAATLTSSLLIMSTHSQSQAKAFIFGGVKFHSPLSDSIKRLGIQDHPSPIQEASLASICSGQSCILHAPTGTGKTFAYILPALKRLFSTSDKKPGQIVIVAPTHELVVQIEQDIQLLTSDSNLTETFYRQKSKKKVASLTAPSAPIIIGTPPRLLELFLLEQGQECSKNLEYLVLDEVDRLIPLQNRYMKTSSSRESSRSDLFASTELLELLIRKKCKLQLVCASATVGRPLRRHLVQLVSPLFHGPVSSGSGSGDYGAFFPVIRPKQTEDIDLLARNQAAKEYNQRKRDQKSYQKQWSREQSAWEGSGNSDYRSDEQQQELEKLTPVSDPSRYISIPPSIQHRIVVDDNEEDSSAARRLSYFNKMYRKTLTSSQRILLFLPLSADVSQTLNILKFWRVDNVYTINVARDIIRNATPENPAPKKMVIVAAFSGTRGLHLPGIDTVFVTQPPKTMDEYLHLAGRTGRLECFVKPLSNTLPGFDNVDINYDLKPSVITIANAEEVKRMSSWQTALGIQLEHVVLPE